jgi:UDP-N-acetylglucosamine 2-epimerase
MNLVAYGTRPEWIKIKPLLDKMDGNIPYRLLFTGQHIDLLSKVGKDKDFLYERHAV